MGPALPIVTDIVLVGGGHSHALVLKAWGMRPLPGVRLTLINPGPTAPYSGMLPGHVAGHYERDALDIDLVKLARFAGARLVIGAATGLDLEARLVTVPGRAPIGYDLLSLDIGIHSEMPEIPGFSEFGVAAKPLDRFADAWAQFVDGGGGPVAVIGAGVAGVELSLAAAHRLRTTTGQADVTLIDRGSVLDQVHPGAKDRLLNELTRAGIRLLPSETVARVTADQVELALGTFVSSTFTLGVAGARPHRWLAETGLHQNKGYITVDRHLRSVSHPEVFAAGDCADLAFDPRPKAGVYAVRAAPVLLRNLRAMAMGRDGDLLPFRPQHDYLKLISLGGKRALAEKRGFVGTGSALWRWKNRIDQKFMDKFRDLSPMALPDLPREMAAGLREVLGDKPMCGGCGAKLGPGSLNSALTTLPAHIRADILSTPGDDAAVIKMGEVRQILTTDHLRGFTLDHALQARIAAVHALGDCWAMGAKPQAALATLILPRLSPDLQSRWMAEIMAEAAAVFAEEGAEIVGGHSSMADELTLGFTVTGLLDRPAITLDGAQPGDILVLTKPLGTGVILAAEMQLRAAGEVVANALAQMAASSGPAARILAPHAHAMTDVTGFGLAGHLLNICSASGVATRLDQGRIPVLPGASALLAKDLRSTIHGANEAAVLSLIDGLADPILFDPQTSGGLLAAIPADTGDQVINAFQAIGVGAAIIGEITAGSPGIDLV
ncbi:selenide, water dikinase SelD [Nioella aestuarii]|uniref:selenide, water dikinase SelD n=1 Tax=Nioella aestuarii TaxID=1662864 RepID=UPI003D7FB385